MTKTLNSLQLFAPFVVLLIFGSCQQAPPNNPVVEPIGLRLDSFSTKFMDTIASFDIKTKKSDVKIVERNEVIYKIPHYLPTFRSCASSTVLKDRYECSNKVLMNFVRRHITYPEEARKNDIQGVCVVTFVIDEEGQLHSYEIAKSIGYGTDEVVTDMMEKLKTSELSWNPGIARGKPVKVLHTLPVNFRF